MAARPPSSSSASVTLPSFLRQSKAEIHARFLDLEWQQRNRLLSATTPQTARPDSPSTRPSPGPPSPWARLAGEPIAARNRYLNVEPYAANRVHLRVGSGGNDYINASPIRLGARRYIATQGPRDSNVNHFYRMLAQTGSPDRPAVVVMLTQTHEAGREKCFPYYPLAADELPLRFGPDVESGDRWYGEVGLEVLEEHRECRCQVRRLRLRAWDGEEAEAAQEREVLHLLFEGWPDFSIPEGEDRAALVELARLSGQMARGAATTTTTTGRLGNSVVAESTKADDFTEAEDETPRIVHCSAGVGRSGTFIALDYLLSQLYSGHLERVEEGRDPIAEAVDSLRQQRMMMVQGESQFGFLYEVLREEMQEKMGMTTSTADGGQ